MVTRDKVFSPGDRVQFTRHGQEETGTVTEEQSSCIVFLKMDRTGRTVWMHETSLTSLEE